MSIESQEEQDNVLPQIIPQNYMGKNFWIGLKRKVDAEGDEYPADFEWTDGTQTEFQHFAGIKVIEYISSQISFFSTKFYHDIKFMDRFILTDISKQNLDKTKHSYKSFDL